MIKRNYLKLLKSTWHKDGAYLSLTKMRISTLLEKQQKESVYSVRKRSPKLSFIAKRKHADFVKFWKLSKLSKIRILI